MISRRRLVLRSLNNKVAIDYYIKNTKVKSSDFDYNPWSLVDNKHEDTYCNNVYFRCHSSENKIIAKYGVDNTILVNNLHIYLSTVPKVVGKRIEDLIFNIYNIHHITKVADLKRTLKGISDFYKEKGNKVDKYWMYFVNLECLIGFNRPELPIERRAELKEWLEEDVVHEIHGSREYFNERFRYHLNQVFDTHWRDRGDLIPSVDDWIHKREWAKGKSTELEGLLLEEHGVIKRGRRSKVSAAYNLDNSKVKELLFATIPQYLRCFQKTEAGKIRDIVCGDFPSYIKMDYLDNFFREGFLGNTFSVMFMYPDQLAQFWKNFAKSAVDYGSFKVPIDQSNFDHNINRDMLEIFFNVHVERCQPYPELRNIMISLKNSILHKDSVYINGKDVRPFVKGIASGWRWTSYMDTLINYTEFLVVQEVLREKYKVTLNIKSNCFMGDDVHLSLLGNSFEDCELLQDVYNELGFKVNKSKNFIANDRDEFLRLVSNDELVVKGYPSRVILAMTQTKPMSVDTPSRYDRINSIIACYFNGISRGLVVKPMVRYMLRAIKNKCKISDMNDLINYILTPSSKGGYGLSSTDEVYKLLMHDNYVPTRLEPSLVYYTTKIRSKRWKRLVAEELVNRDVRFDVRDSVCEQLLIDRLPYKNRGTQIKRWATFKQVPSIRPTPRFGAVDRRLIHNNVPVWRTHELSSLLSETIKRQLLEQGDLYTISDWLTPESKEDLILLLNNNASQGVISAWLRGEYVTPSVKFSNLDFSYTNKFLPRYDLYLRRALSLKDVTITDMLGASMQIEDLISYDTATQCNENIMYCG